MRGAELTTYLIKFYSALTADVVGQDYVFSNALDAAYNYKFNENFNVAFDVKVKIPTLTTINTNNLTDVDLAINKGKISLMTNQEFLWMNDIDFGVRFESLGYKLSPYFLARIGANPKDTFSRSEFPIKLEAGFKKAYLKKFKCGEDDYSCGLYLDLSSQYELQTTGFKSYKNKEINVKPVLGANFKRGSMEYIGSLGLKNDYDFKKYTLTPDIQIGYKYGVISQKAAFEFDHRFDNLKVKSLNSYRSGGYEFKLDLNSDFNFRGLPRGRHKVGNITASVGKSFDMTKNTSISFEGGLMMFINYHELAHLTGRKNVSAGILPVLSMSTSFKA